MRNRVVREIRCESTMCKRLPLSYPIGVGRTDWFRLPLPPNRIGGSPASGSPVGGFTSERIDKLAHGQMLTRTARALQSKHLAIVDDRDHVHVRVSLVGVAECFGVASESSYLSS